MRRILLSITLLFTLALAIPLSYSAASFSRHSFYGSHRGHKHSRAWWKRYRAWLKKRKAALARRRAEAAQRAQAKLQPAPARRETSATAPAGPASPSASSSSGIPMMIELPDGWYYRQSTSNGDRQIQLFTADNRPAGQASLGVVTNAASPDAAASARDRKKSLGGIPLSELRRIVIDKMISAGGWVVNDFDSDVEGRRVFVVVAQTAKSSDGRTAEQSWRYYFTEINGRIYRLATNTPVEFSDRIRMISEKALASIANSITPGSSQAVKVKQ